MSNYTVFADDIKGLVNMADVFRMYGVPVTQKGYAVCPFHNEKTASLKVYPKSYYCFGCGAGGDCITFVRDLFNCDFKEAVRKLNDDFALGIPIDEKITLRQADHYKKRQREIKELQQRELYEQERRIALQNEYLDLLEKEQRLKDNFEKYRPREGESSLHPLFVEACRMLEYTTYKIESFNHGWEAELIQ